MTIITGLFKVLTRPITRSQSHRPIENVDSGTTIPDNGVIPPEVPLSATMKELESAALSTISSTETINEFDAPLETRPFSIARTLDDIPPPEPCPFCGSETDKSFVPYNCVGAKVRVENNVAPGYRCRSCGAELFDPTTDRELALAAADKLDADLDSNLREILLRHAERAKREEPLQPEHLAVTN